METLDYNKKIKLTILSSHTNKYNFARIFKSSSGRQTAIKVIRNDFYANSYTHTILI